jgi:hypothetical protein
LNFSTILKTAFQLTFSLPANETVPENGIHCFAVYHIKAPTADEKPRDTWTNHKGNADGKKRLPVDFKNEAVAVEKKSAEDTQEVAISVLRRMLNCTF